MLDLDPAVDQSEIAEDWHLEGVTDAAFGRPPEHPQNSAYLEG